MLCGSDKPTSTSSGGPFLEASESWAPRCVSASDGSRRLLRLLLLYHNALGLAFTLLKEHEYIIIHTKEQVIVYELPAFPATKAIFIRKLNFILAPI